LYADMSDDPEAEFESPFEASVYEALTDRGLHLRKQVGVSGYRIDLAVVDSEQPGRYLLGIECDGAMYHSAATARDRDRLRQKILEDLGWCMHRIWSRDWIENRNREIKKVLAAVERSRKREHSPAVRRAKRAPTSVDASSDNVPPPVVTRSVRKLPPEVQPYKKAILRRRGLGAASFHNTSRRRLVEVMQEIVNSEGPIEISVAKRRMAEAWGIKRIGHKIDSELNMVILAGERKGVLKKHSGFLWPVGMNKAPVRVPQGDSGVRPVEQIAPEELSEAAYICVKAGLSLDEDDLIKQTAWLFGLHATSKAVKRIGMAIQPLIETGRLERRGGKIRLPRS
jgi:very-short-patch-repair endonuclease